MKSRARVVKQLCAGLREVVHTAAKLCRRRGVAQRRECDRRLARANGVREGDAHRCGCDEFDVHLQAEVCVEADSQTRVICHVAHAGQHTGNEGFAPVGILADG